MASPDASPSEASQEALYRNSSGPFVFDHDFTRENAGRLEDVYNMQKVALGEGSFGSAFRATCKPAWTKWRPDAKTSMKMVKGVTKRNFTVAFQEALTMEECLKVQDLFQDQQAALVGDTSGLLRENDLGLVVLGMMGRGKMGSERNR
eukprot:g31537.t1